MKIKYVFSVLFIVICADLSGQVGGGMKITRRQDSTKLDSLENATYPYKFPIFGDKVTRKGFVMPLPAGIMLNTVFVKQDVVISDLSVGINDGEPVDLSNIVQFGDITANIQNANLRADLWVFPFLNVYALAGVAWTQTKVGLVQPISFSTEAKFSGGMYGVGVTAASGIRGAFFTLDFNSSWVHFKEIEGAINTLMLTPRIGHSVQLRRKDSNIAYWFGATRLYLNRMTTGSIKLSDIIQENNFLAKLQELSVSGDLSPVQQQLVDNMIDRIENLEDAKINYSLKKRPTHDLTFIVGAQYQLSSVWQFRTEMSFWRGRTSALFSANYRFGF